MPKAGCPKAPQQEESPPSSDMVERHTGKKVTLSRPPSPCPLRLSPLRCSRAPPCTSLRPSVTGCALGLWKAEVLLKKDLLSFLLRMCLGDPS